MLPIHQIVEPGLEIFRPEIPVVDVIGMLPDVAAEQGPAAMRQRVLAVRSLGDRKLAVLQREPAPARAELGLARLDEVGTELVESAKILVDHGLQLAWQLLAAAALLHPGPEMIVVEVLAGVVEDGLVLAVARLDDFLEAHPLEAS